MISTTQPDIGGKDILSSGVDDDYLLGGFSDDILAASEGNNVIIGDNGEVNFTAGVGLPFTSIRTLDSAFGGNDQITAGAGTDYLFGGFNFKLFLSEII